MKLNDYAYYNTETGLIENVLWLNDEDIPNFIDFPPPGYAIVDIPEGGIAGTWSMCGIGWSYINGEFVEPPKPPKPQATAEQNKAKAEQRLAATDWVNQPDVYDPANTPHLLNRDEFLTYRSEVRAIAVNPVAGNLDWPVEPTAQWSS